VAMKMLKDQLALDPNLKPKIFVLSDGETTKGYSFNDTKKFIEESGIPIYTIGYNANIEKLNEISASTEAASIDADTEDVNYVLAKLFEAEL